jgi:hypothetical protein
VSIDTETTQHQVDPLTTEHRLELGVALYSRRLRSGKWSEPKRLDFEGPEVLFDWLETLVPKKERLVCLAHNWSFDAQVLGWFQSWPARGWEMGMGVIDGPPWIVSWSKDKHRVDMLDTMNWWPIPLARLGESLGIQKGSWEVSKADPVALREYCAQDALIVLRAVQRLADFVLSEDLGGFASTAAGQAYRAWRHAFMGHQVLVHADEEVLALERSAYHGGRVECRRIGPIQGPLFLLDVTSMYPSVMLEHDYPTVVKHHYKRVSVESLTRWLDGFLAVADVTLEVDSPAYGVVHNGRLIFPVGTFRTTLTTPELRRALSRGEILEVHSCALYEGAPIFRTYVEAFWARRLEAQREGNPIASDFYKLLLNGLYGKFGQGGRRWEIIAQVPDFTPKTMEVLDADTGDHLRFRQLGGAVQVLRTDPETSESCPAIAAHVTAYARLRLWNLAEQAGLEHVYYMDTDSLLVDEEGAINLAPEIAPGTLGKLKIELECTDAELWGPKDYRMGNKVRTKGVRSKATRTDAGGWEQDCFRSMVGALRAGEAARMIVTRVTKFLRRRYLKGMVRPDGGVDPFRLTLTPEECPGK